MLELCLVTIDAMGCQRNIAQHVVQGGADCCGEGQPVKGNQGELHENLKDLFACCDREGCDWFRPFGRVFSRWTRISLRPVSWTGPFAAAILPLSHSRDKRKWLTRAMNWPVSNSGGNIRLG